MATIDLGLVKGRDGVSPTITVSDIEGGHRITITDANGSKSFDVLDGENVGSVKTVNGVSPNNDGDVTLTADKVGAAEKDHTHNYVPTSRVNQDLNTTSDVTFKSVTVDVVYGAVFME